MSNPDSFIDEVTEEVRRDRLFALLRRYGWIAVLLVLMIVAGAAWNEWSKARETAQARALGDAILAAMEKETPEERVQALEKIDAGGEAAALARLLAAGEAVTAGDSATAAEKLKQVAGNAALPTPYRQLATLKWVMITGDETPVGQRRAALEPLTEAGAPFRALALEQLALLKVEEGDPDAAIELLQQARQTSTATAGLRQRVTRLIVALGGRPDGP